MSDDVPAGFALADLGEGFGRRFGPVYFDRARRKMGFRVSDWHVNPVGTCHGGALATFSDTQLQAIRGGVEEGLTHSPTISLDVDFLAPARLGDWVEADVVLVKTTRTMIFTQSILNVGSVPIARSSVIYRNKEPQEKQS